VKSLLARTFGRNTQLLQHMIRELTDGDMLASTGASNTIGWILGHILLTRGELLHRLQQECHISAEEQTFKQGVPKNMKATLPLELALREFVSRGEQIIRTIHALSDDALVQPLDLEPPGGKGNLGTLAAGIAWHETFHLGQIDLIKVATGKAGIK